MQSLLRKNWKKAEVARMNEEQINLIETVMDMISGTAEMMLKDPYHAPPAWLIENWWHSLNAVLTMQPTSSNPSEEP